MSGVKVTILGLPSIVRHLLTKPSRSKAQGNSPALNPPASVPPCFAYTTPYNPVLTKTAQYNPMPPNATQYYQDTRWPLLPIAAIRLVSPTTEQGHLLFLEGGPISSY